ncbi:von_Willebrand factor type A domain-containing protein [Hexamita inflata]|uniref:von Willebrand factor type A domain-containing protein n=1 Tax=Hexamita inflata TaxID=28002 RepID=A0AA86UPC6_9EUKA|nr:von Willebrand factor type A domain-containing protein [Hexamita inflata]
MKEDLIEVIAILDVSGSMFPIMNDTIGGFNAYLQELASQDQEIIITLILFSNQSRIIIERQNVKSCIQLTEKIYRPMGGTALIDALGLAITNTKQHLQQLNEDNKPGKVSFFVSTDGEENSSKMYSKQQVRQMVKQCIDDQKWEFIFAGANIDAFATGESLGFERRNIANIENDGVGQKAVYEIMAKKQSCNAMFAPSANKIYENEAFNCDQDVQAMYSKRSKQMRK